MKTAPPKLDGNDNPSAVAVLEKKMSCLKFASAIAKLHKHKAKKGRPSMSLKGGKLQNAGYMSGRIYGTYRYKPCLRVYTRSGDKHEQRFPYDPKDKNDVKEKWHLACSSMELDPRPVK